MARDRTTDIEAKMETLEVTLWDEDPDGDPDREGEGWYYRFGDADSWNGAYETEGLATETAEEEVVDFFEVLDRKLDQFSALPQDGLVRFLVEFGPSEAVGGRRLFAWPKSDGKVLTLVDAKDADTAVRIVETEFGHRVTRLQESPVTLDEFCRVGLYAHPDPEPPAPALTP